MNAKKAINGEGHKTVDTNKELSKTAHDEIAVPYNYGRGIDEIEFSPVFGFSTTAQCINLHKVLCTPVCLGCCYYHANWSLVPCLYTALHGTYSICWLLHSVVFPSKSFEVHATAAQYLQTFVLVALYWSIPYYSAKTGVDGAIGIPQICAAVSIYTMGMFVHFVSDAHKYYALKYKGKGLITDGMFTYSRNPNYVGEVMIYVGFALLQTHWKPWAVNFFFWSTLFVTNASNKDKSLSRYDGWNEYKRRSGMFVPGF